MTERELENSVAIVTGGARGIGRAIAEELAAGGATVVVADISGSVVAAADIAGPGGQGIGVDVDVSDEHAVAQMVEQVLGEAGRVDILVNNAALFTTLRPGPFSEISVEEWRRVMDVNVLGPFLCARAVAGPMRRQGGGRIINIASSTVFKGTPYTLHYVVSKGGIVAFTRALARELGGDGILVNAVAPGLTLSAGLLDHPDVFESKIASSAQGRAIERPQHPADVVGTVRFLSGPASAFITGQTIVVDGGSHLH